MTALQPVRGVRLYERIVEQVEDEIAAGRVRPGEHLPSERELVAQTGASRATVREALRVLESQGVVRSRHGDPRGPEVLGFSPDALGKQLTRLAAADGISLADLIGYRMILDSSATLLAAARRTDQQLVDMTTALDDMRRAIGAGYDTFSHADVAFHTAVADASGNQLIRISNDVVRAVVLRMITEKVRRAVDSPALMRRSVAHHAEVLAAIRSGDASGAAHAARRTLFDYYAGFVPAADRRALRTLVDDR